MPDISSLHTSLSLRLDPYALARELSGKVLIGGALRVPKSNRTVPVHSPATGRQIGEAAMVDVDDVDEAVTVAAAAQKSWAQMSARDRGRLVAECGRRLEEHVEEIARLVALETGKAIRTESRAEAAAVSDLLTFYGGLGSELKGETIPFKPDMLTMTHLEPIGVVGAILPWNSPVLLLALKAGPALVAGNAVVVKAAEEATLSALRTAQIMASVLPPGLLNVVSGAGEVCGAALVAHPRVGKVTFTGSVETGRIISRSAAEKLIPVTLELGGKSPMIVMPDADLERAVIGAVAAMRFTRQGQSCTAATRIFVHSTLHDAFVTRLKERVDALVMGDPLDEATDIGTIISRPQYEKVRDYIATAEATKGVVALHCSALPEKEELSRGYYVQPVILTGIGPDQPAAREEIFGPVTCIFSFDDYDAAIEAANDSDFGLAASIWTNDMKVALDATRRLQAGVVQVNQSIVVHPGLSYGGVKNSGLGKEGSLESMREHFTHKKLVIVNLN